MKLLSFNHRSNRKSTTNSSVRLWSLLLIVSILYSHILPCECRETMWQQIVTLIKEIFTNLQESESSTNTTTISKDEANDVISKNDYNTDKETTTTNSTKTTTTTTNSTKTTKNSTKTTTTNSTTTTKPFVCPEYDDTLFYQQNYEPYLCFNKKCFYSNSAYVGGANIDIDADCQLKCPIPMINTDEDTDKNDIIYGFFICDDDCLYENSYDVKEAGFNITKDCIKG